MATFTQPPANPPVCWICDRKLYAGGRAYVMVPDEEGREHPAHKGCAADAEQAAWLYDETGGPGGG